jgi:hypothetical protein
VRHEDADAHTSRSPDYHEPFPLERFTANYGECHGHLRRYLSPTSLGREQEIEGRYFLLRPKVQIICSWMNARLRQEWDFPWICRTVIQQERLYLDYLDADRGARRLVASELWGSVEACQRLVDELGLGFTATNGMLENKIGATPRRWKWSDETHRVFRSFVKRFGRPDGV